MPEWIRLILATTGRTPDKNTKVVLQNSGQLRQNKWVYSKIATMAFTSCNWGEIQSTLWHRVVQKDCDTFFFFHSDRFCFFRDISEEWHELEANVRKNVLCSRYHCSNSLHSIKSEELISLHKQSCSTHMAPVPWTERVWGKWKVYLPR